MRVTRLCLVLAVMAWWPARAAVRQVTEPGAPSSRSRARGPECPTSVVEGMCLPSSPCGMGELSLDGYCVPLGGSLGEELGAEIATNLHVDRVGRRVLYEHLPRRRELPADYERYVYPLPHHSDGQTVTSGYDLDRPDALQRRGSTLSAVGHGGVDIPEERGAPVRVTSLRGEQGEPEVVYVGWLFGNTVVLRHVLREGTSLRTYLALHGHLESAAPGIAKGQTLRPGTVLGFVGDSGAEGVVHLHYETRLVRPGVDPSRVEPGRLNDQTVSVPCDPRNVLPFR